MGVYSNWLDSYSDKVEVGSSSLPTPTNLKVYGSVAQLDRVRSYELRGREFNSLHFHQLYFDMRIVV